MEEKKKSSSTAVIIIILLAGGCLFAVPVIGILAAIAIPAFLRYIKMSKVSEAQTITRQMSQYAEMNFTENCEFPVELTPTSDPATCCGGQKCLSGDIAPAWRDAVPGLAGPTYFSYAALGDGDTMTIIAQADLTCGDPAHTMTVVIQGQRDGSTCSASVMPAAVEFELE